MEIGNQIRILRRQQKISSKKLVQGLCTERALNYIEAGKELPDKMLADVLIQRLGKSPDKLELIISREIYQLERMQDLFEEALERGNRRRAEELIETYEEIAPKSSVYRMFYCRSRAYLSFRLDKDVMEAKEWLMRALELTLPDWRKNPLEEYLISTMEMENLLAYVKCLLKEGTRPGLAEAEELLNSCREYIDAHILDGEEHAKIYCKCVDLLAELALSQNHLNKVSLLCEKAFDELRDFGILYYMRPLLDKLVLCEDSMLQMERREMYQTFRNVLGSVYERYGEAWRFTDSIFKNCCQRTYYMDYELIRGERLAQGITQEQLIEGIYENPESLSRVESGKSSPGKKTLAQLFEKLGIEKGRYNTFVATESFEVLEMKKELDRLTSRREYEKAEAKLAELKETLDLSVVENSRVVRGLELALENVLNKKPAEQLLEEMIALLQETYPVNYQENSRVPLDREAYLLNYIGIILKKLDKRKEIEELYTFVLDTMQKSKIRQQYRFRSYSTLITNYAKQMRNVMLAGKNIRTALKSGKCRLIHMNYTTQISKLIDDPENETICRVMLEEAYVLCSLIHNDLDKKKINQYYEKWYAAPIMVGSNQSSLKAKSRGSSSQVEIP